MFDNMSPREYYKTEKSVVNLIDRTLPRVDGNLDKAIDEACEVFEYLTREQIHRMYELYNS